MDLELSRHEINSGKLIAFLRTIFNGVHRNEILENLDSKADFITNIFFLFSNDTLQVGLPEEYEGLKDRQAKSPTNFRSQSTFVFCFISAKLQKNANEWLKKNSKKGWNVNPKPKQMNRENTERKKESLIYKCYSQNFIVIPRL